MDVKVKNVSQNRTKCQVNFVSKYTENILNGTDPVLKDGLIPVEISDNGIVTRAKLKDSWYSYEDQKWANAVILTNESKEYYEGEEISEGDIESYFVWIPRYRYKIFNEGNYETLQSEVENRVQTIEVEFEDNMQKIYQGSTVGSWLTHPAFTSFDTNGIWVGKFETGYEGATDTASAQVNINDSSKIQIKPNVYSWRGIQVANAFYSAYNYRKEYDSHMMKNTEWGAVAYLSNSKYGIQDSIRINNNSAYLTGYAGVVEPTTGYTGTNISCTTTPSACNEYGTDSSITQLWNTTTGVLASTTGNISGIYDMSGGAWEYVMGVMLDSTNTRPCSGRDATYNSGFSGPYCYTSGELTDGISNFPRDTRYYDTYTYNTVVKDYQRRILGDATGEMGPFSTATYGTQTRQLGSWYNDEAWFVYSSAPWFSRGGLWSIGLGAVVFALHQDYGSVGTNYSFRIVLSV